MTDQIIPGITFQASSGKSIEEIIETLRERSKVECAMAFHFIDAYIQNKDKNWIVKLLEKGKFNVKDSFPELRAFLELNFEIVVEMTGCAPFTIGEWVELHALMMEHLCRVNLAFAGRQKMGNN